MEACEGLAVNNLQRYVRGGWYSGYCKRRCQCAKNFYLKFVFVFILAVNGLTKVYVYM